MAMDSVAILTAAFIFAIVAVALHQWLLDSPLLELGEASWFPQESDLSAATALARSALSFFVPLTAWLVASVLVLTAPFPLWVWGVVVLLALTVTVSPVFAVYRYDTRPPTAAEATILKGTPDFGCEILVVTDSRSGPINGYAIGGPFRDVVGVSEFALERLPPAQVAALLAHETTHHRERHVLIRGTASLLVLGVGSAVLIALFDALTLLATLGLVAVVFLERVVAYWAMRHLEYRADAVAARCISVEAVRALLITLDEATDIDQPQVSWLLRLFSTHPTYADRLKRLEGQPTTAEGTIPRSSD